MKKIIIPLVIIAIVIGALITYFLYSEKNACLNVFTMDEFGEFDWHDSSNLYIDGDFYLNFCETDFYDCNDFCTQGDAQKVFDECALYGDVHHLDSNNDGIACESLQPTVNTDSQGGPEDFSNYEEAIEYVRSNPVFNLDKVDTSKSSWIRGAEYCYQNGSDYGYAIFNLQEKEYIHKGVPKEVWEDFKDAESFGSYYNKYLKGEYTLYLNR